MNKINDLTPKELLDVKAIIQFGTRLPEDYKVLFYNEVFNQDVEVRIRGLSTYEYDLISLEMYNEIKDTATINYIFNPKNEDTTKKAIANNEDNANEQLDAEEELPDNINVVELTKAYTLRNVLIVFYAMKDYYKGLTLDQVKQIEGLDEIAQKINEKSGRTKEMQEKIHFFRGKQTQSATSVPSEEGTHTMQ